MGQPSILVQAPAKLNLALSVGPPDPDGMHPICSWMVTLNLHDEIQVTRLEPDRIARYAILWHAEARRRSEIDWSVTRDLAVRAHLALEDLVGGHLPVQMKLEKRIPVGGGLGGGSSNAAAMLRATNELFELGLEASELRSVATGLGSDVPFFLTGGSAVVEGFGERVEPHDNLREVHAVLVFPEAVCPTGPVYDAYDGTTAAELRPQAVRALATAPDPLCSAAIFNDLTEAAITIAPELEGHRRELASVAERAVHVAGSGSTLFVLCDDELHAQFLAKSIEERLELPAVAVRTAPIPEAVSPAENEQVRKKGP